MRNDKINKAQHLRLQRFGMSMATFVVVLLSIFMVTCLGLGDMNGKQWAMFVGLGLLGAGFFFCLFWTNVNLRFSDPSLTKEQIFFWSLWGFIALYWLPAARPILLLFYMPPFSFGILIFTLRQYLCVVAVVLVFYLALLSLECYQDPQGFNVQYQLFLFAIFGVLLIWFAFFGGFVSKLRKRLHERKTEIEKAHSEIKAEMEERIQVQIKRDKLIVELEAALSEVKVLSGFIPICASCKKIRDDKGYWDQIESYIAKHSNAKFSHGICPECVKKLYPDCAD